LHNILLKMDSILIQEDIVNLEWILI